MATSKIAADAVELAEDIAEEFVVQIAVPTKNNPILLAGVALVAASAGGFVGYKYAVRKLTPTYEKRLAEELEASKKFLKTAEFATPESAVEELIEPEDMEQFDEPVKQVERIVRKYNQPVEKRNVFVQNPIVKSEDDEGGDDVSQEGPYKVSFNDFHSGGQPVGWSQLALTYYAEDDTLADENDQPIDSVEATIGVDILDFIRKSKKETVYVRNPLTQMDFEVAYCNKSYKKTVLGWGDDEG